MPSLLRTASVSLLFALLSPVGLADPVFTPARLRSHVGFLADDLLEGRDTGSRGHQIAARYVAAQFEAFGLTPAGDAGGWYQQVGLQRIERVEPRASVWIGGPGGERQWLHGEEALVSLGVRERHVELSAPLIFVGYGIQNARLGLDDYTGLDVRGKVVVVLAGFPKGMPSEEGAHCNATKGEVAARLGALGMVTIGTLQSMQARPWAQNVRGADAPRFATVDADGLAHDEAPGLRAGVSLNTPPAQTLFEGSGHTLAAIRAEADRPSGRPRGFALKTRIRIQGDTRAASVQSPNVVAVLPGSDPALAGEYVVLSAHLDHLGVSPEDPAHPEADRINNGALDNASGIGTMLEVARALAESPQGPRRSVLFLASTGEEKGLLGADYFARHPTVPIAQIVGNVDLDMPLLLYPFTDVIAFGANHSTLGPIVAAAVAPMGIALSPDPMPEQGIFTRSDHYRFVRQGVPAVFLATGFANGGEQAWQSFLNGAYHHPNDDMQQPIDWVAGARFVEANYRITRLMADADLPPRWFEGDFFGDTFAPKAARAPRH
jgi:Peptidase family M28